MKKLKVTFILAVILLFILGTTITAHAAISGSGQATGEDEDFTIYSPASSLFGHVKFEVTNTNTDVYISMLDPNNNIITYNAGQGHIKLNNNDVYYINMTNAPAGTYRVDFWTLNGSNATVKCSLHDWWH